MVKTDALQSRRRSRNFQHTHRLLIEKAIELISKLGADAVSISALAKAVRINRSTVYYHFDTRETLITAVQKWSSEQLAKGISAGAGAGTAIGHVSSFILNNPEITKLWIDDYIAVGDIRERYSQWEALVAQTAHAFAEQALDEDHDAEVFCTLMLTSAFIAPRVFKNSVCPHESLERIVERFTLEQTRMLQCQGALARRNSMAKPHSSSALGQRLSEAA